MRSLAGLLALLLGAGCVPPARSPAASGGPLPVTAGTVEPALTPAQEDEKMAAETPPQTVAPAGESSYHECQIANGQIASCQGSWFQGETVAFHDGAYRTCTISNGQVFACDGAWFQGEAVVLHDGAYRTCTIANGQVFTCEGAWFQGSSVVLAPGR